MVSTWRLKDPLNKYVQKIRQDGVPVCIDVDEAAPPYVFHFLKADANSLHNGAGYTPSESLSDVELADQSW